MARPVKDPSDKNRPDVIVPSAEPSAPKSGTTLVDDTMVPRSNGVKLKVVAGTTPFNPVSNVAPIYKEVNNKIPLESSALKTLKEQKEK